MSTYVPIQAITLTATATSVTFSGIPQTYTDLVLVAQGTNTTSAQNVTLRFNGDSNSLYSRTVVYGDGTSALSLRDSSQTSISLFYYGTGQAVGIAHIMNYANTTTNKTVISRNNDPASSVNALVGLYRSTSAITSITLTQSTTSLASGSTFTLYGIGSGAPKAFGGDEVRTDGTYWYHIFRSSGRFEPVQALSNVDFLVIAGGGGGGSATANGGAGGGGGAGGYRCSVTGESSGGGSSAESKLSLVANTAYTVTVGAGGAAALKGSDSVFATITSAGGGAGRTNGTGTTDIANGGSGGGSRNTSFGLGTANQGYNAGDMNTSGWASSGGGGAGAVGGTATSPNGGNGGAGVASSISGSSVTRGGGGGGGGFSGGVAGSGGSGGGAAGTVGTGTPTAATANTGGGGGGVGGSVGAGGTGGAGGSGIVIVRYSV